MRILNVGCGDDTYGTDFIDVYPQRPDIVKCNIEKEELPYAPNTFDEVYCRGLFEHMKNPHDYLAKVYRVLKPGGKIVIVTDNAHYWVWALSNSIHLGGYEKETAPDDKHFAVYTEHHMKNHLYVAGFTKVTTQLEKQPSYSNALKKAAGSFVNFLFWLTPLRRMSYMHIRAIGVKPN